MLTDTQGWHRWYKIRIRNKRDGCAYMFFVVEPDGSGIIKFSMRFDDPDGEDEYEQPISLKRSSHEELPLVVTSPEVGPCSIEKMSGFIGYYDMTSVGYSTGKNDLILDLRACRIDDGMIGKVRDNLPVISV
jgi:hypothetical protein